MLKRGTVVLLVVVLAAITGATVPRDAQAYGEPPPFTQLKTSGTSSSLWATFKGLLSGQGSAATQYGTLIGGETPTTQAGVKTMLYRARVGARFLPTLGVVATRVSLVGTAAYIGWRIYQHYNGNDTTIDLWIDSDSLGKDSLANPCAIPTGGSFPAAYTCGNFRWYEADLVKESGPSNCSIVGTNDCWVVEFGVCGHWTTSGVGCGGGGATIYLIGYKTVGSTIQNYGSNDLHRRHIDVDNCTVLDCYYGQYSWDTFENRNALAWLITRTQENLIGRNYGGASIVDDPLTHTVGTGTVTSHRLVLPDTALGTGASVRPESGTALASPQITTDYNAPGDAGNQPADATKALAAFDTVCGRALINHLLAPAFYPWVPGCIETAPAAEPEAETLTLLRPLSTETYTQYITRLQDAGWLGTATLIELDPYDPSIGPEAVSKVGVTGKTGTWRRSLWPAVWPQIALTTDLDIYHNPTTAPPVAPDPTDEETPPGGGDVYDPGGCEPWLEASPDFTPLTSLTFGNKFPFGLFTWVGSVLGSLSVVADAPSWDFHIVIPATSVSGEADLGHFVVDLEWADDYMATVRLILTFVLWIGAVWFFATSLLGIRAPGNPAEAVDEA